jgi:hypothetical protein
MDGLRLLVTVVGFSMYWKLQPLEFPNGQMSGRRDRRSDDAKIFGLNNWWNMVAIAEKGGMGTLRSKVKIKSLVWDLTNWKYLLLIYIGDGQEDIERDRGSEERFILGI